MNELSHEGALQNFYVESLCDEFVGRKALLKQCTLALQSHNSGLLVVTGKHGSGKSSLMVNRFRILCLCFTYKYWFILF